MLEYPIAIFDLELLKHRLLLQNIRLNKARSMHKFGTELYEKNFKGLEEELKILGVDPIISHTKPKLDKNKDNLLREIYMDACKEFHPDLDSDNMEFMTHLNSLYQEGEIVEFLEAIQFSETPSIIYEKIIHINKEIDKLKAKNHMHLAHCYENNKPEYYNILIKTIEKLKNDITTLRNRLI